MDMQNHVARVVLNDGNRVSGGVVEEVGDLGNGGFCRSGLRGGYGPQCNEHREVHCDGVVDEGAHDALDGSWLWIARGSRLGWGGGCGYFP